MKKQVKCRKVKMRWTKTREMLKTEAERNLGTRRRRVEKVTGRKVMKRRKEEEENM